MPTADTTSPPKSTPSVTGVPAAGREADNPWAYIAGDRRRALAAGVEMPDRVRGAALFADISGFTALTEALVAERGPQRGAEELTAALGVVFDALLGVLHRHGGVVIYFSGDAVTCWLDGDDGTLATACGLEMQDVLRAVGEIAVPSGTTVRLAMKVAVAVGAARRFVVGDPDVQLIDVLAGRLMDDLAAAEAVAGSGEVVLDASAIDALGDRVTLAKQREEGGRRVGVVTALDGDVHLPAPLPAQVDLPDEVVRQWLLPPVWERLREGRGEFLAELRSAVPLFLRFTGIDFDSDPRARDQLDDFVRRAQRIVDAFGGSTLQLTIGDKGAYLYAVFGSPLAHEDDAARACAAALGLRDLAAVTAVSGIRIGIASGRLLSGTYGHATRRTFCCLGDAVNLAARLMSAAPDGGIYVADAVAVAAGQRYTWEARPDLAVKGKAEPIRVHVLRSSRRRERTAHVAADRPLVGRDRELAVLLEGVEDAAAGRGRVIAVRAGAGIGKSRLLAEAVAHLDRREIPVYEGAAPAFGATPSYAVWHIPLRRMFGLAPDGTQAEQAPLAALAASVGGLDPALVPRVPLLGAVLGLSLADNDLTASLDPELRKASLESLLIRLLRLRSRAGRPFALLLEDCQGLDPLSRDLLEAVARAVPGLPVLVLLAYRPMEGGAEGAGLPQLLAEAVELVLDGLDPAAARVMAQATVRSVFGLPGEAPPAVVDLVVEGAEGNPFFIEELAVYLRGQLDPAAEPDAQALRSLDLPDGLHSLVLSRVDTLTEWIRRVVERELLRADG